MEWQHLSRLWRCQYYELVTDTAEIVFVSLQLCTDVYDLINIHQDELFW